MRRFDPQSPDFTFERSPLYWLTRVSNLYVNEMGRRLKRIGMDVPRWRVLMILAEKEPASVSELGDHAIVKLATMAKIVQRMGDDGLIVARPRASDARVTEAVMTESGRAALEQVRAEGSALYREVLAGFEDAEVEALNAVLGRVFMRLREAGGSAR